MNGLFLVSGFGRCGTSLLMQMLDAGGFPIYDRASVHWPAFEHPANMGIGVIPADATGAMKWIDPQRFQPPLAGVVLSLFLRRDPREQAKSQIKFASAMGMGTFGLRWRDYVDSFRRDEPRALAALRRCGPVEVETFEDMLIYPRTVLAAIAYKTGVAIDIERGASVARVRSPACYLGLLEERIIAEGEPGVNLLS